MNVTVDVADDCEQQWKPDNELLTQWIETVLPLAGVEENCNVSISLRFVEEGDAAVLNRQYRGKQSATNVLSFPADLPAELLTLLDSRPLGDIVICPAVVERQAREQGKELPAHWAHLLQHGVLHLLGFHHDDDASAEVMEALEIKALQKLGLANPYLIG